MHNGQWDSAPPCNEESLQELVRTAPIELPVEYISYLRESDGGGGDIAVQPGLIWLWQVGELRLNNEGYAVAANAPGFAARHMTITAEDPHRNGEAHAPVYVSSNGTVASLITPGITGAASESTQYLASG